MKKLFVFLMLATTLNSWSQFSGSVLTGAAITSISNEDAVTDDVGYLLKLQIDNSGKHKGMFWAGVFEYSSQSFTLKNYYLGNLNGEITSANITVETGYYLVSTFYIQGGLGIGSYKTTGQNYGGSGILETTEMKLALNFGVGYDVMLNKNSYLKLEAMQHIGGYHNLNLRIGYKHIF